MDYEAFRKLNLQQGIPGTAPVTLTTIPGTEPQGYVDYPDQEILANIEQTQNQAVADQQAAQPQPREPRGGIWDAITEPFDFVASGDYGEVVKAALTNLKNNPISPSAWFSTPLTLASGVEAPLAVPQNLVKETIGDLIAMGASSDAWTYGLFSTLGRIIPGVGQTATAFYSLGQMLPDNVRHEIASSHKGEYGNRTSGAGVWEYMQGHMDSMPTAIRVPLRIAIELAVDPLTYAGIGAAVNASRTGKLGRIGRTADEYDALNRTGKIKAQLADVPRDPLQGIDLATRSLGVVSDTLFMGGPARLARAGINQTPARALFERSGSSIQGQRERREGDDVVKFINAVEPTLATNETPMVITRQGDTVPNQEPYAGRWQGSADVDSVGSVDPRSGRGPTTPLPSAVPGASTYKIVGPNRATAERYIVTETKTNLEFRVDVKYDGDVVVSGPIGKDRTFQDVDDAFDYLYGRITRRAGGDGGGPAAPPQQAPPIQPQPTGPAAPAQPQPQPQAPVGPTGPMQPIVPQPPIDAQPQGPVGPVVPDQPQGPAAPTGEPTGEMPTGPAAPEQPTGNQAAPPDEDYPSGPDDFDGGGQSGPQVPRVEPDAILDERGRDVLGKPKKKDGPSDTNDVPELERVHPQFKSYKDRGFAIDRVADASAKATTAGQADPHAGFWREYADAVEPYGDLVDAAEADAKRRKLRGALRDTERKTFVRALGAFHVERLGDKHGTPLPASPYTTTEGSDIVWRRHNEPSNQLLKNRFSPEDKKALRRDAPLMYEEALMTTNDERARAIINVLQSVEGIPVHTLTADEARLILPTEVSGTLFSDETDWGDIPNLDVKTQKKVAAALDADEPVKLSHLLEIMRRYIRNERANYTRHTPFKRQAPPPFFARGRQPGGSRVPGDSWMDGPNYMPRDIDGIRYDGEFEFPDDPRLQTDMQEDILDPPTWRGRTYDGAALQGMRDAVDYLSSIYGEDGQSVGRLLSAPLRRAELAYKNNDLVGFHSAMENVMFYARNIDLENVDVPAELMDYVRGAAQSLWAHGEERGWTIRPGRDAQVSSGRVFQFPYTRGQEMAPYNYPDPEGLNTGASQTGRDAQLPGDDVPATLEYYAQDWRGGSTKVPSVSVANVFNAGDVDGARDLAAHFSSLMRRIEPTKGKNLTADTNVISDLTRWYDLFANGMVDLETFVGNVRGVELGDRVSRIRTKFNALQNAETQEATRMRTIQRRVKDDLTDAEIPDVVDDRKPSYYRETTPDDFDGEWDAFDPDLGPRPDGYWFADDGWVGFSEDFNDVGLADLTDNKQVKVLLDRADGDWEDRLARIYDLNKKFDRARADKTRVSLSSKLDQEIKEFWDTVRMTSREDPLIAGSAREIEDELYRATGYEPQPTVAANTEPPVNDGSVDRVSELFASGDPPPAPEPDVEAIAAADAADEFADPVDVVDDEIGIPEPVAAAPTPEDTWTGPRLKRFRLVEDADDSALDLLSLSSNYTDAGMPPAFKREIEDAHRRLAEALNYDPLIPDRVNSRIERWNEIVGRIEKSGFDTKLARDANVLDPKFRRHLDGEKPWYANRVKAEEPTPVVAEEPEAIAPTTEVEAVDDLTEAVLANEAEVKAKAPKKRGRPRKTPAVDPISDPKKPLPEPTPEVGKTIDPELRDETKAAVDAIVEDGKKRKARKKKPAAPPPVDEAPPPADGAPPPADTPPPVEDDDVPLGWEGRNRPWDVVDRLVEAQIIDTESRDLLNTVMVRKDIPGASSKERSISVANYYLLQRQLTGDKEKATGLTLRALDEHRVAIGEKKGPSKIPAVRVSRKALNAYGAATNNIRERVLWNIYTGPMLNALNLVGNSVNTLLEGNVKEAVDQYRPSYIIAAYRAVRDDKLAWMYETPAGKYFDDMGSDVGRDVSINLGREGSPHDQGLAFNKIINEWSRGNEKSARRVKQVLTAGGVRGSEFISNLHGAIELVGRTVNMEKHAREVAYQPRLAEFVQQLKTQYTKTGNADAVIGDLLKRDRPFSPDDVRTYAIRHGFTPDEASDLGQQWKRHADAVQSEGVQYAEKVLFSYNYTNADNLLRSIFMFHYWYMRASARYTRAIVRNPYLMVNYQRAVEGLERESEGEPNAVRGMLRAFSAPGGYLIWIDPAKAVATAATFHRQAVDDGDEKKFDSFMAQSGLFLNPMIQAAAAVMGMTENRNIDPTGTGPVRRIFGAGINAVAGEFGWGYQGTPFQDAVGNAIQEFTKLNPLTQENQYQSSEATNRIMIRNGILDAVMEKHNIAPQTPLSQWSFEAVNELELELSNFDSGVPSKITDRAFRDWSRAKFLQTATAVMLPVGTSLRSETRDERLNINRGEAFDQTPAEGELQITQSSPEGMSLTLRNEQFGSLFPSGELGRVDVSPDTGLTQQQVLDRPEMAPLRSFKTWQREARRLGPMEFAAYMMQASPAYRQYVENIPPEWREDAGRYENSLIGYQAFLAANGKRGSMYDPAPLDASAPQAMDPAMQLFAWMQENGYTTGRDPFYDRRPYQR